MTQTPTPPVRRIPTTLAEVLEDVAPEGLTMAPTVFAVLVSGRGIPTTHLRLFTRHERAAEHLTDVVRLAISDLAGYVPIPLQGSPSVRAVLDAATGWGIEAHLRESAVDLP